MNTNDYYRDFWYRGNYGSELDNPILRKFRSKYDYTIFFLDQNHKQTLSALLTGGYDDLRVCEIFINYNKVIIFIVVVNFYLFICF
jgi:hypothetical protein